MFNPTPEQVACLNAAISGQSLVINAFAGTGKTSTLQYITNNYYKKTLYVAFNKTAAEEAAKKFPKHVECRTLHSLAYQAICKGSPYGKRLQNWVEYKEVNALCANLTIKEKLNDLVSSALVIVKEFGNSDDSSIVIPEADKDNLWLQATYTAAQRIWSSWSNPRETTKIIHDVYFKLWQLSKPKLGYDLILLDEAQDSNPATIDVMKQQSSQVILVGDKYQSIYAWRGAVNAMDALPSLQTLYLTESFRFNQDIADKANVLLAAMGSTVSMKGVGGNDRTDQATLVRTNFGLVQLMQQYAAAGQTMYVEADLKELWSAVYTANAMRFANDGKVEWPKWPSKAIQSYGTWQALMESKDNDVVRLVKLVQSGFGHKDIQQIKCLLTEDRDRADVLLCTGHKSKGLEYGVVTVGDDFLPYKYEEDGYSNHMWLEYVKEQGANLLYVAMTRATNELIIGLGIEQFLEEVASN
jgi:superfamily I DNA/RNA helicase